MKTRRWWLCLPPTVFALFDYVLTMQGQTVEYWNGAYEHVNEDNPIVRWMMTQHPYTLHALTLAWFVVFSLPILWGPRLLARLVSLGVTAGHVFGTTTWLHHMPNGYYYALTTSIVSAFVFVAMLELSREDVRTVQ